ncbi:MAG: DUF2914 domain-containing protein [Bacteriovoracia bacterium]
MDYSPKLGFRNRLLAFYEKHETRIDMAFFLGGFLLDVSMLPEIDDFFGIIQQVGYLAVVAAILFGELLLEARARDLPKWFTRAWEYRSIAVHFSLGALLNLYSLFFLKSASFFSSAAFVILLLVIVLANESKAVKRQGVDVKMGLFLLCLFCSFSILFPLLLGHVGWLPFFLALFSTTVFLFAGKRYLKGKVPAQWIQRRLLMPGAAVIVAVFLLYQFKLIPPVPLSVKKMGVYHGLEKKDGKFLLQHERPWWKFWRSGDQDFYAAPGDRIYFFATIYSPARFDDTVTLHWWQKDARGNWMSTDQIPMRIAGGRREGFRGFSVKQNYTLGDWCVAVETTDGREIGRMYFTVSAAEQPLPGRVWQIEEN